MEGLEQGRKDDLISLGYTLLYLLKGELPWMDLPVMVSGDKLAEILKKKKEQTPEKLCEGLPLQFLLYFQHVCDLGFSDAPNYLRLKNFLQGLCLQKDFQMDFDYDWILHEKGTWKLPPSFCFITSNYFYKFLNKEKANPEPFPHCKKVKLVVKKTPTMASPHLKQEEDKLVEGSPLSHLTAEVGFKGSNELITNAAKGSPSIKGKNDLASLNGSVFSDLEEMEEEPNITEKLNKLMRFSGSQHTFKEVKSKFCLK